MTLQPAAAWYFALHVVRGSSRPEGATNLEPRKLIRTWATGMLMSERKHLSFLYILFCARSAKQNVKMEKYHTAAGESCLLRKPWISQNTAELWRCSPAPRPMETAAE